MTLRDQTINQARACLSDRRATRDEIVASMEATASARDAAVAAIDRMTVARQEALVGGTAANDTKRADEIKAEEFTAAQLGALHDALSRQLADVDARAKHLEADRAKLDAAIAKGAASIRKAYPAIQGMFRAMMTDVAEAGRAVADFVAAHPGECPPRGAEALARFGPAQDTIVEERRVWGWIFDDGRVLSEDRRLAVHPDENDPRNRSLIIKWGWTGQRPFDVLAECEAGRLGEDHPGAFRLDFSGRRVWPRKVLRQVIETSGALPIGGFDALATAVKLPALCHGDFGWDVRSPDHFSVLHALAQTPRAPHAAPQRVVLTALSLPAPEEVDEPKAPPLPRPPAPEGNDFALDVSAMQSAL